MKKNLFMAVLSAAMLATPAFAMTGCGITGGEQHVCESKCPTCGYCTDKACKDPVCEMKCPGHKAEKVTVKSVDVVVSPKTDYYPGQVFDITGLVVKANLSNGKSKNFFDSDFVSWTHKDEALTADVNKITFTLPGYDFTFDLTIKVGIPEDMYLIVDTTVLKDEYSSDEKIDFSLLTVKTVIGKETTALKNDEWALYNGGAVISDRTAVAAKDLGIGEITLTVRHISGLSTTFTIKIVDAKNVITPAVIEAEDNVFLLSDGKETTDKYKRVESNTIAEFYENGTIQRNNRVYNGFSGKGVVTNLDTNYQTTFFKFSVNVPENGKYDLHIRAQHINYDNDIKNKFNININGQTDADGNYVFTKNTLSQTVNCGNQLKKYCTLPTDQTDYKGYYNMFWWSNCKLGTFELNKGENTIRVYMAAKIEANIDCFEVTTADDISQKTSIFSMRSKTKSSLNGKTLYLPKGEKLTDIAETPVLHPVKYTLLYLSTSTGKEIPVLESMLEGKVDYEKVGEEQIVTVTDPVSKESASFTLFIEETKE